MNNSYLQAMNQIISDRVNQMENTLVYGENLDRGSFISGLSKNLVAGPTRLIKNIGNCERQQIVGWLFPVNACRASTAIVRTIDVSAIGYSFE